jgi:transposase-like protein
MRDWAVAERDLELIRRAQAKVEKRREALRGALEERRQAIQRALDSGETLATIGEVLGVTRQWVKQLPEGEVALSPRATPCAISCPSRRKTGHGRKPNRPQCCPSPPQSRAVLSGFKR